MGENTLDKFENYLRTVKKSGQTIKLKFCANMMPGRMKNAYYGKFYIPQKNIEESFLSKIYDKIPKTSSICLSYRFTEPFLSDRKIFFDRATCAWYENGAIHRIGGPAHIDYTRNTKTWYYHGQKAVRMPHKCEITQTFMLRKNMYLILRHLEGEFYEALCGDTKRIVVDTTHYEFFDEKVSNEIMGDSSQISILKTVVNHTPRW